MKKIVLTICICLTACLLAACDSLAMRYLWAESEPPQPVAVRSAGD